METGHGQSWNHVDDKSTVYLQSQCCACNCHLSEWEAPGARNQGDKVSRIRGKRPHVKLDTVDIRSTPIPLFPFGKFSSVDGTLPIHCSGRCLVRLKRLRTSEKVRDRVGRKIHVKLSKKQGSLCNSLFGNFRSNFSRIKMIRFFCHCALVILITSCAGVYMINNSANTHPKETSVIYKQPPYKPEESIPIIRDIPFRSISLENFKKHLKTSRNPYDLLRIFFEDSNLSDFTIETVMKMKSKHLYSSKTRRNFPDYEYDEYEEGAFEAEHFNLAWKHITEMDTNPDAQCRDPRPEVVSVVGTGSTLRYYAPDCTIIHRCRNTSGCCGPNMVCAPKMLQIVEKPFLVLDINKDGVMPRNKQFVVYETFVNHTECECRQLEGLPACDKKCPRQFTMSRPHSHCECTCLLDNNNCLKIYKGLHPLDEKSLECIKSGDCLEPQCHTGKFNVRNGFCPVVHPHEEYKKAVRNRGRR